MLVECIALFIVAGHLTSSQILGLDSNDASNSQSMACTSTPFFLWAIPTIGSPGIGRQHGAGLPLLSGDNPIKFVESCSDERERLWYLLILDIDC